MAHRMGSACRQLQGSKSTRRSAARDIAAASVVAAAGIYDSMNTGANTVLHSGGETASSFIGHKYTSYFLGCYGLITLLERTPRPALP